METKNQTVAFVHKVNDANSTIARANDAMKNFLDEQRFKLLTIGHPIVMKAIAQAFLKHTPAMLEELTGAIVSRNRKKILDIIHKLKSSASVFASTALIQKFDDLKGSSLTASHYELMDRVIQIKKDMKLLYNEIIQFVSRMGVN